MGRAAETDIKFFGLTEYLPPNNAIFGTWPNTIVLLYTGGVWASIES